MKKIISLNVNGFRGEYQNGELVPDSKLISNLKQLKEFIDKLDMDDESVVLLQEIPHEIYRKFSEGYEWIENEMFNMFKQLFEEDYKIFYPKNLIHSQQCTVAVGTKNTKWKYSEVQIIQYDEKYSYGNKIVEIEIDGKLLLGIHMNPCDKMWNMILEGGKNKKPAYVVGDFNSYEKRGKMKDKPKQLRQLGYYPCVPSNVITDFRDMSSLDNLYLDENICLQNGLKVNIYKPKEFVTDHAVCIFEF